METYPLSAETCLMALVFDRVEFDSGAGALFTESVLSVRIVNVDLAGLR